MIQPGSTFLGVDPGNHLHIVISRRTPDGQAAFVNFTTHYPSHEERRTCLIVQPGEHSWIVRATCVAFEYASLRDVGSLPQTSDGTDGTGLRQHDPLSEHLLRRIQLGALESDLVPSEVKEAVRATLAAEPER